MPTRGRSGPGGSPFRLDLARARRVPCAELRGRQQAWLDPMRLQFDHALTIACSAPSVRPAASVRRQPRIPETPAADRAPAPGPTPPPPPPGRPGFQRGPRPTGIARPRIAGRACTYAFKLGLGAASRGRGSSAASRVRSGWKPPSAPDASTATAASALQRIGVAGLRARHLRAAATPRARLLLHARAVEAGSRAMASSDASNASRQFDSGHARAGDVRPRHLPPSGRSLPPASRAGRRNFACNALATAAVTWSCSADGSR